MFVKNKKKNQAMLHETVFDQFSFRWIKYYFLMTFTNTIFVSHYNTSELTNIQLQGHHIFNYPISTTIFINMIFFCMQLKDFYVIFYVSRSNYHCSNHYCPFCAPRWSGREFRPRAPGISIRYCVSKITSDYISIFI